MSFSKHTILDFLLIFFFGIKLPNRVPLNHPINEAATKTLTFSVILFELPSEHCACGHGFIGFAEPMSPLRFMHTHSYLRPPTIQRLCAGQCPLHWAGCSEEWTTIACSMTDVVTGDTMQENLFDRHRPHHCAAKACHSSFVYGGGETPPLLLRLERLFDMLRTP